MSLASTAKDHSGAIGAVGVWRSLLTLTEEYAKAFAQAAGIGLHQQKARAA